MYFHVKFLFFIDFITLYFIIDMYERMVSCEMKKSENKGPGDLFRVGIFFFFRFLTKRKNNRDKTLN